MLKTFKAALQKDFKLLFRSWASLFLIVIGPLALILVLMLAFSNIGFTDITIGYTQPAENTKYSEFIPKIGYLGNFVLYPTVTDCTQDLRSQKIHLCLEPTTTTLRVHFDNTREVISLILLNQIRIAVTLEKEALVKVQATSFLGEVREVDDFLGSAEKFSDTVLHDLQDQRQDLVQEQEDLHFLRQEVTNKRQELQQLRSLISDQRASLGNSLQIDTNDALQALQVAEASVAQAYQRAVAVGDQPTANDLSVTRTKIQQSYQEILLLQTTVGSSLDLFDALMENVDDAVINIQQAEDFLSEREEKIGQAIRTIDQRSVELRNLQDQLRDQRRGIDKVNGMSVEDITNPISVDYQPQFLASKRLQQIKLDKDLAPEEKQRLINFGTLQTFLPIVILLLVSFIATILGNIMTLDEIHSSAFLRNRLTPTTWVVPFLSQFVTINAVTLTQSFVILGVGYVVFFLDLWKTIPILLMVLFLLIGTYSLFGATFAYLIKTKTTSLLVSAFFLLLNLLLGGILYPTERMASFMSIIAQAIPFTTGISLLQQSMFYGVPFSFLWFSLLKLCIIFITAALLLFLARWLFFYREAKGL
ncbi:ABC transporter permease [Candidatus Woesearchaeota archaeon]|nr:ABC transporter permease [Candidatus Woesearchaeota archaeon]